MTIRMVVLCSCACLCVAAPATGKVLSHPVKVVMVGEPRAAEAGRVFEGAVAFETRTGARLEKIALSGSGWTVHALEAPALAMLQRGERLEVRFRATPNDPDQPLRLDYEADGKPEWIPIHVSPRALQPFPARSRDWGVRVPAPSGAIPLMSPYRPNVPPRKAATGTSGAAARTIRVHGKVTYFRVDGPEIGAYQAHIYIYHDVDGSADDLLLGELYTFSTGVFDMDVTWDGPGNPNLLVVFTPENPHVAVEPWSAAGWFYYRWASGVWRNFAGDDLNVGTLQPQEDQLPALHIMTTMTREYIWLPPALRPPGITAHWPDSSATNNSHYDRNSVEIFIADEHEWSESVQCHEYGHYWLYTFGAPDGTGYDNGICDPPEGPRHCDWCGETGRDAWNEGFCDWLAYVVPASFADVYDQAARSIRYAESLQPCVQSLGPDSGLACPCDPLETEGFLTALLYDLDDNTPFEDDPLAQNTWRDRFDTTPEAILAVASDPWAGRSGPQTVQDFIDAFKATLSTTAEKEAFWETAKNAGYEVDEDLPGNVVGLASPSHTPGGGVSRDNTITFTWGRAPDDASGNYLYSVSVTPAPATPPPFVNYSYATSYTTAILAAGTWYFNIRAIDRSGKVSATKVSLGPFTVDEYQPIDLTYYSRPGWADVLVPRADNDATLSVVPAPATLTGGGTTYWNLSGRNTGEEPTAVPIDVHFLVDGSFRQTYPWGGPIAPFAAFHALNQGPVVISGGRHTIEGVLDAGEDVLESSGTGELNNLWAHQWIWSPLQLAAGTSVARVYPPDRDGGRSDIVDGSPSYYNCDGLRLTTTGPWNAVWTYGVNFEDDFDCRLHTASTGPTNGFSSYLGWSSRAAGCLDAVLVNRNQTGNGSWDVGVLNFGTFDQLTNGSYRAKHVVSTTIDFDDSVAVSMPVNEMMLLREFSLSPAEQGLVSITVTIDPAEGPIHVAFFDASFTTGDLTDESAFATSDPQGRARLDLTINSGGWNAFAIYRDPKDGTGAIPMVIELERTEPDFEPYWAAGWYAPLVPRAAFDGTPASVPAPASLTGNAASTYYNYAALDNSPASYPSGLQTYGYLDGVHGWTVGWGAFAANGTRLFNSGTARTVRGGRHTVAMVHDGPAVVEEIDEDDNLFGEQWVWTPLAVSLGASVTRTTPPDRIGGWGDITSGPHWYNCDGLRTPVFAAVGSHRYWGAVAVMPGDTSDVDVRLHELSTGAKSGFAANLVTSGFGLGLSDFVLVDFHNTGFRAFDAGVLSSSGPQSYTAQVVSSLFRGGLGSYGPDTLGAGQIVDLNELVLPAGTFQIQVENLTGTVDWGVSVHGPAAAYYAKTDVVDEGIAWLAGAGASEQVTITVPAGNYCVAVWKSQASDLSVTGGYRLNVSEPSVGVPAVPIGIAHASLAAPWPNPFEGTSEIAFALPSERDVRLEIFDVRGSRVRTLIVGRRGSGRHVAEWDGRDDSGNRVSAGAYLVRLRAGETHVRRLVLVR